MPAYETQRTSEVDGLSVGTPSGNALFDWCRHRRRNRNSFTHVRGEPYWGNSLRRLSDIFGAARTSLFCLCGAGWGTR